MLPWRVRVRSAEGTILGGGMWLVDIEVSSARLRCVIVFKKSSNKLAKFYKLPEKPHAAKELVGYNSIRLRSQTGLQLWRT